MPIATAAKPTVAQLRFLLAVLADGPWSRTAMGVVSDWRPINTCRDRGWAISRPWDDGSSRVEWFITDDGRDAARYADPDGYVAAVRAVHATRGHDLNLTEVRMSDCQFGCKIYRCDTCEAEMLLHSAAYGCRASA